MSNKVQPVLTVVVPCYNAEDYMGRAIESVVAHRFTDVELIIVNDGSSDRTAEIADDYVRRYPGTVQVVHKENGGHGSGINAGRHLARGTYFKVLDADDWFDGSAFDEVVNYLRKLATIGKEVDLLVTNFVYEKQGKLIKRTVDYRRALPLTEVFNWDKVRRFRTWEYLLMHSITYRTALLHEIDLQVPEKSFYVDNYFAFVPLPKVAKIRYLDVDLYRYFIGRSDQSVNEDVMMRRIDQQLNVNILMSHALSQAKGEGLLSVGLEQYMTRYLALVTVVSSTLLVKIGTPEAEAKRQKLWQDIAVIDPEIGREIRGYMIGSISAGASWFSRLMVRLGYRASRSLVGFN